MTGFESLPLRLVPHPDARSQSGLDLGAGLTCSKARCRLNFMLSGDTGRLILPPPAALVRTDNLWKTTCFELFVRVTGQTAYREYNFSPSGAWAAYAFDGYRAGMRDLPLAPPPHIQVDRAADCLTLDVSLPIDALPPGRLAVGLSAVIEEQGGAKSWWALAHPPGAPDFHHADCFALELPAWDAS